MPVPERLNVTPEKAAEYSAFMREVRSQLVRPDDSDAEALAAYYAQLDAERCKFFGVDHWPRGCSVQVMSQKGAANAATIAELEADYGLKLSPARRS